MEPDVEGKCLGLLFGVLVVTDFFDLPMIELIKGRCGDKICNRCWLDCRRYVFFSFHVYVEVLVEKVEKDRLRC